LRFSSPLLSLISAAGQAADLHHDKATVTKPKGNTAIFSCSGTSTCETYLHLYQKKDGEPYKRILYLTLSGGKPVKEAGYEDFEVEKKQPDTFRWKISKLEEKHSATYICACWVS
ncbi:hypothetical protein GN956_G27087, partial [Arapaima gigas]